MAHRVISAGALAAVLIGIAGSACAADLDYNKNYDREPYAPYYDHGDKSRDYDRKSAPGYERRYSEERYYEPPGSYPGSYKDEPPRRYSRSDDQYAVPPARDHYARYDQPGCLPRGEIRFRLKEHGWHDFQEFELRRDAAVLNARRPDGLLYRLKVDRCTGVILHAQLVDDGRGWRPTPRAYGQTY